jgi:V/A-type H+/Na+-transporting ATPase subunit D
VERLPVSINKTNLFRLRDELSFAKDGLDLLDEKKEILMTHITTLASKAELVRTRMTEALERTYEHLREAVAIHGIVNCEKTTLAAHMGEEVEAKEKSFMGVPLPVVLVKVPAMAPSYGFLGTGAAMDSVAQDIHDGIPAIAELAEIEVSLFLLTTEVKKTIRRINALDNIYIPAYEATIKHIEESLEEKEREFLFQLKRRKGFLGEADHE